jgi:hypothetical protein
LGLGAARRYTQSVAVRILQVALPPSKTLFVDGKVKLPSHGVDVLDVEVDQGIGAGNLRRA